MERQAATCGDKQRASSRIKSPACIATIISASIALGVAVILGFIVPPTTVAVAAADNSTIDSDHQHRPPTEHDTAHDTTNGHGHANGDAHGHHAALNVAWPAVIPFAVLLLCIAILPLVNEHWWESNANKAKIALPVGLGVTMYLLVAFPLDDSGFFILESVFEYTAFMALLGSLYITSGGILIRGEFYGTPRFNTTLLAIGAVLASFIGTTGAAMLLIRPLLRANKFRPATHVVVFFIFIVANCGGLLTPLGDPPLFLGFLKGVPFEWTLLHLLPQWALVIGGLLGIFFVLDSIRFRESGGLTAMMHAQELDRVRIQSRILAPSELASTTPAKPDTDTEMVDTDTAGTANAADAAAKSDADPQAKPDADAEAEAAHNRRFGIEGITNFGLLFGVVLVVLGAGIVTPILAQPTYLGEGLVLEAVSKLGQATLMGAIAVVSLIVTPLRGSVRRRNEFTFTPIVEVAVLFAGIFLAMIPALQYLNVHGKGLITGVQAAVGIDAATTGSPWIFFWATGLLSGFLDNAPTYLTFLSTAQGALGIDSVRTLALGTDSQIYLQAISCGAVFMGAMTYIGNGPNFMVKAISEGLGVRMPTFFGYMVWSFLFLIPLFILVTVIFFGNIATPDALPPPSPIHR